MTSKTSGRSRSINIGESAEVSVRARDPWNPSGVLMEKGAVYRFQIVKITGWDDAGEKNIDPLAGWTNFLLDFFSVFIRCPGQLYFRLIGGVSKKRKHFFPIDPEKPYTAEATGEFFAFANDLRPFYFNNHGVLILSIARVAP